MKKLIRAAALSGAIALALAACGNAPDDEATTTPGGGATDAATETSAPTTEPVDFKACMVSDSGGFEDKSFNQSGAEGLERAGSELGVQINKVESTAATDFTPNIEQMLADDCDLIIGVGFLLEDPIQAAAEANPDVEFALVDSAFSDADFNPVTVANAKPLLFNTQEAAFLAGYVAASVSTTGTVATFGGIQLPSVSIFMDGFADGVAQYNTDSGKTVKVLGWDKAKQTGRSRVTSRTRPTARTWPRASSTRARTSSCPSPVPSASVPRPPRRTPVTSRSSASTPTGSSRLPTTRRSS